MLTCDACKKLQPFPASQPDYFQLFGLSPAPAIDEPALRETFYELSRKTHPDAHAQSDSFNQLQASKWSTLVNKAFQTLRNKELRLEYLLETIGRKNPQGFTPPIHLAERYFELQETLSEGPNEKAIAEFLVSLEEEQSRNETNWEKLVSDWATAESKESLLPGIKKYLDTQKYLNSMKADLNRTRGLL
ncbi:hypothetical protein EBT16_07330 [bacterium]|nr:hypothetical protein [bacterium]